MNVAHTTDSGGILWWCPGCKTAHVVPVTGPNAWGWNGSLDAPTLTPSVLVYSHQTLIDPDLPYGEDPGQLLAPENKRMTPQCHTFIRDGRIEFLGDCTHELAGQTVPMQDLED